MTSRIYRKWKCDDDHAAAYSHHDRRDLQRLQIRLDTHSAAQVKRIASLTGCSVNQLITAATIHTIQEIDAGRLDLQLVPAKARIVTKKKIPG